MSNSPRPLNGSEPNFLCREQMVWNRKRGVKLLKSVGGQVVEQKCNILVGLAHTKSNMAAKRENFSKKQRYPFLAG